MVISHILFIGGGMMNDVRLMKQEIKEFNKQIHSHNVEKITIKYQTKKVNETNVNWTIGDPGQYENVPCFRENVSRGSFVSNQISMTIVDKNNFYIPYGDIYDFKNNEKRNIVVVDENGLSYNIDKVIPQRKVINGYLSWKLIQI